MLMQLSMVEVMLLGQWVCNMLFLNSIEFSCILIFVDNKNICLLILLLAIL